MVKMKVTYQGRKQCELIHGPSQSKIETDAPKDNGGKGERFSPTDLIGVSLASCVLTTLEIIAERDGLNISLEGSYAEVEKNMASNPRRIESLTLRVSLPQNINLETRKELEGIAQNCPVRKSLHPDMKVPMTFEYTV